MARTIDLPFHKDSRGSLTVAETAVPFVPKRVFWITGADGQTRGGHRHKSTETVLVALHGVATIKVHSPSSKKTFVLDSPHVALYIAPEDWHTMSLEDSSVLLAIVSTGYDPSDYITQAYD